MQTLILQQVKEGPCAENTWDNKRERVILVWAVSEILVYSIISGPELGQNIMMGKAASLMVAKKQKQRKWNNAPRMHAPSDLLPFTRSFLFRFYSISVSIKL